MSVTKICDMLLFFFKFFLVACELWMRQKEIRKCQFLVVDLSKTSNVRKFSWEITNSKKSFFPCSSLFHVLFYNQRLRNNFGRASFRSGPFIYIMYVCMYVIKNLVNRIWASIYLFWWHNNNCNYSICFFDRHLCERFFPLLQVSR